MTYPVKGLHYGPALAVTLWTQAGSIPGNQASDQSDTASLLQVARQACFRALTRRLPLAVAQPECPCQPEPGCVCELASASLSLSLRLPACQRDLGRADPGMPARGCPGLPVCCLSKPPGYLREPKVQVTMSLACGATIILLTQSADSPTFHWSSARRASLGCCVPSSYQLVLRVLVVACLRSAVCSSLPAVQIGSPLQASLSRASASAEMPRARDFCAKISLRDHPRGAQS